METTYSEFNVGDTVQVVDEPYTACPFHWVSRMNQYLGKTVTIRAKEWATGAGTYMYGIEEDKRTFNWCGNCFQAISEDIPDIDEASFLSVIGLAI